MDINLVIICFTVLLCVAMITSTIDKAIGKKYNKDKGADS